MTYVEKSLPSYPCVSDMWDELQRERRPIVVYGMGNGADKLIERFDKYDIEISDFFASDGFVRGHSFHGFRVKSFSEIKETYGDFVIVLSFASNREEVIEMLEAMDRDFDMYVPDMPIAGVEEYFDREFYNSHYSELCKAYALLSDAESKRIFASVINYKLSGRLKYLSDAYCTADGIYAVLNRNDIKNIIDAGAYNGDTVRESAQYFSSLKTVFALEPDKKNFKKLERYIEAENKISVKAFNAAAWDENAEGALFGSGNRNSTLSSTASFEHKDTTVPLVRIDSIDCGKIDYIKYDVEGAEMKALIGSDGIILRDRPALLVSLYHRSCDIFAIPLYLAEKYPWYRIYLRRRRCIPAWEIDLILINNEGN